MCKDIRKVVRLSDAVKAYYNSTPISVFDGYATNQPNGMIGLIIEDGMFTGYEVYNGKR